MENAAQLLRSAPAKVRNPEALPILEGELSFVYAYIGAPDRVLEFPERAIQTGALGTPMFAAIWQPLYTSVRKTERFKALMRNAGLVDYWRARGWPDLCHPTTGDDFECS